MNHLFYNTFGLDQMPFVFLCGDESLEVLSAALAREITGQGKTALLVSDSPMPFPVEGQVLVDIRPELLKRKIDPDSAQTFYLCSAIDDDRLIPVDLAFWKELVSNLPPKVHIISLLKKVPPVSLIKKKLQERFVFINTFGYGYLEENLTKLINEFEQREDESFDEAIKTYWQKWASAFCPQASEKATALKRILYLNHVKSLIDENRIIPIVRNLTDLYDQVFIGDINEYKLKEI